MIPTDPSNSKTLWFHMWGSQHLLNSKSCSYIKCVYLVLDGLNSLRYCFGHSVKNQKVYSSIILSHFKSAWNPPILIRNVALWVVQNFLLSGVLLSLYAPKLTLGSEKECFYVLLIGRRGAIVLFEKCLIAKRSKIWEFCWNKDTGPN